MYPSSAYPWTGSCPHNHHPACNNNPNPIMHHFAPPSDTQKPIDSDIPPSPINMDSPHQLLLQHPLPPYYCFPPVPVPVPVPHEYHHHGGCCNHTCFAPASSYTFRPPYFPHYQPPPFQSYGSYPPFPGAHLASYSVPPPHYSTEQPRYDYEKNPHRCCGCSHPQDDNNLNIQPQEPQLERKTNDSLAPLLFKDCPYPIMWVPPRYMKTESKTTDKDKDSPDPVSLKHLEPSKAVENGELARDQLAGDGKGFPFPVFWLPSNNHEMRKDPKEKNNLDLVSHKGPDAEKRETTKIDNGLGGEAESETSTKHVVQKVIPVKPLGTDEEKKSLKSIETKAKSNSLEKSDNRAEGKDSPKTSKLPPVCLRVDPLPRKKSSRSPSPPADKERLKGLPVDSSKSSLQQRQLSEDFKKIKEEQSKDKVKTIEVANAASKIENESVADHGNNVERGKENGSQKVMAQGQSSKDEPYRVEEKKNMSVNEAALIIQSVYRGFEARKSKPLMKLRQISEVRNQVVELRKRIQDLASSSTTCINDKGKLIIGETIMSLLLKLDTIQGLHPIVRDIRKSVAKELVGLQEKLDSLTFVKSETPIEETMSSTELVMHPEHVSIEEGSDRSDDNVKLVESEAAESRNDDGADCNVNLDTILEVHNENRTKELTNNQLQVSMETKQPVDDAVQEKFDKDQVPPDNIDEEVELDTCISENHEAEATDFLHQTQATKPEKLVEKNTVELKDNQFQMSKQPVDDATQEKSDQLPADPDSNVEIIEANASVFDHCEVEVVESQEDGDTKSCDEDGDTKSCDIRLAPEMEPQSQPIVEEANKTQLEMSQIEHPVGQVMFNKPPAQFDGDVENVVSWEHSIFEAAESPDDGNVHTLDRDVIMADMKVELPKKDAVNGVLEDDVVATEETLKVDEVESSTEVIMDDVGGTLPVLPTGWSGEDGKLMKDVGEDLPMSFVGDGDRTLLEENKKLRMAVEELVKARKEQFGVISELTERVKDVEKKLCKKKKMKVNKKCNSRRVRGFEDELVRDCLV